MKTSPPVNNKVLWPCAQFVQSSCTSPAPTVTAMLHERDICLWCISVRTLKWNKAACQCWSTEKNCEWASTGFNMICNIFIIYFLLFIHFTIICVTKCHLYKCRIRIFMSLTFPFWYQSRLLKTTISKFLHHL